MQDYKQLLADFDRWTGKGNLIQANQTAAKLFRLIFADREAVSVSAERAGKTFLAEGDATVETQWTAITGKPTSFSAENMSAADLETIANQIEWMRAEREAGKQTTVTEIGSTITMPDAVSPEEALATVTKTTEEKAPPTPKKKTTPKKGSE